MTVTAVPPVLPAGTREYVPIGPYTTLGIGGPARYFVEAASETAVREALAFADARGLPVLLLGEGSNLLVADAGFPGLVLRMAITGIEIRPCADGRVEVTAGAGENWDRFVAFCVERDLAGVECLSGIPGLVGGTPVQNVGAYGQEVSQTITNVRAYDRSAGRTVELSNAACGFAYRTSVFNTSARGRYVVLAVSFALTPSGAPTLGYADLRNCFAGRSDMPALAEVREAVLTIRARKAMVLSPDDPDGRSAGSFFKNPLVDTDTLQRIETAARDGGLLEPNKSVPCYSQPDGRYKVAAAWLIERAGFAKGYRRGPAAISSKHTLALTNRGGATAQDVLSLMREIQAGVHDQFGVDLHPEPVFVGFDEAPGEV